VKVPPVSIPSSSIPVSVSEESVSEELVMARFPSGSGGGYITLPTTTRHALQRRGRAIRIARGTIIVTAEPAPASEPLVQARGLTRRYGPHVAVRDFDLSLSRGQVMGLLGPNGAGKTTAVELVTGNLAPHAGSVRIAGHEIETQPRAARAQIGYLPDDPPLYPELRVAEYLHYCAALHGMPAPERRAAARRVQRWCHLDDHAGVTIRALSRGYRQRVGLAQAMIHDPAVIVLDEPTIGLDPIQLRQMRELITALGRDRAVLLSSHVLAEVEAVCTDVAILASGRIEHVEAAAATDGRGAGRWRTAFRRPPPARALQELDGVDEVQELGDGRFDLDCSADPGTALMQRSMAEGWELYELHAVSDSLERRFMALTGGEGSS